MTVLVLLCSLIAVVSLLVVISGRNAPSRTPMRAFAPVTGFGGYQVRSPVDQLSAAWGVPAISASSPAGQASTWIGIQSRSVESFVQAGTTEMISSDGFATYEAFWSDAAVSYRPQLLMGVHAGDEIQCSITRQGSHWDVLCVDRTEHVTRSLLITSATVRADVAEWVQEDPAPTEVASADGPYPTMASPVFTRLSLNDAPPILAYKDAQVLSARNGTFYVPSHVQHDGFGFIAPRGPARQYLIDAAHFDSQYFPFVVDLLKWRHLGESSRSGALSLVEHAYASSRATLLRQRWPERTRTALVAMADEMSAVVQALRQHPPDDQGLSLPFAHATATFHLAVDEVRESLGLPPAG